MTIRSIQKQINQMQQQQMVARQMSAYNLAHIYAVNTTPGGASAFIESMKREMNAIRKDMQTGLAREIFGGDADYWTWRITGAMRDIFA